ncbi:G patch domain containing [Cryptosporidium sp. chipmunk genotype I]|uniref:G patch domain containing n=1 Tax=Cryptosporidium sp. chipmunk genotype I TaxID=1280935 RepID=UPI00351A186A|nr:G patch domain containing [Cryptosporidium sp. chipmunk genotype I]
MSKSYFDKLNNGGMHSTIPFSSNIGVNLLQKMGWTEGKGLGKEEVGMQECIQIKKKNDNLGLGAKVTRDSSKDWSDWWKDAYNNVANKLSTNINDSRYEDLNSDDYSTDSEGENKLISSKSDKFSKLSDKKKSKSKQKVESSGDDNTSNKDGIIKVKKKSEKSNKKSKKSDKNKSKNKSA